jgi:creatinine amidohydrolase/Fe(II)-dependent formamide hydrolase-like protein
MKRIALCVALLGCGTPAQAQIRHLATMTAAELRSLDRDKTVVLLEGAILEEHGPFLPVSADGFQAGYLTRAVAETIVARPGWTVVIFPTIPLGHSGANDIGAQYDYPGTFSIRSTTMRAIFMDLADQLGEQHVRWAFIIHPHGDPEHNRMLDQAAQYFTDSYGGRMVHLTGLMSRFDAELGGAALSVGEQNEAGMDIHAGTLETSEVLFLAPGLVSARHRQAPAQAGKSLQDLAAISRRPDWNGYFGSPRLASAARGAGAMRAQAERVAALALDVLDGRDLAGAPRYGDVSHAEPGNDEIDAAVLAHEADLSARQAKWIRGRNLRP